MEPNVYSFDKHVLTTLCEWRSLLEKVLHIRKHKPSITRNIDACWRTGAGIGQSSKNANGFEKRLCVFGKTWCWLKPLFIFLRTVLSRDHSGNQKLQIADCVYVFVQELSLLFLIIKTISWYICSVFTCESYDLQRVSIIQDIDVDTCWHTKFHDVKDNGLWLEWGIRFSLGSLVLFAYKLQRDANFAVVQHICFKYPHSFLWGTLV